MTATTQEICARLRSCVQSIRTKPTALSVLIPIMQLAADRLEQQQKLLDQYEKDTKK